MNSAVLREFNSPLSLEEAPKPSPGPGEALVKVMASGLCATDVHIIEGIFASTRLPYVPGHEMAGIVEAVGEGADKSLVGRHVVASLDVICHCCKHCQAGRPNLCSQLVRIGFERDGSHQQYCAVPAENLCVINKDIPFEQAAIVPDAVACMLHAIKCQGRVQPGQWVCVMGAGGIGLQGVQLAKHYGAKVIATARNPQRLALATEMGADYTVNTSAGDFVEKIHAITGGDMCDVVVDCIGIEQSPNQALSICTRGGRVVLAAYTIPEFKANYQEVVIREKELVGTRGSTKADLQEAMDLVAAGAIIPYVFKTIPLADINQGLDEIRNGTAIGRIVVLPWT